MAGTRSCGRWRRWRRYGLPQGRGPRRVVDHNGADQHVVQEPVPLIEQADQEDERRERRNRDPEDDGVHGAEQAIDRRAVPNSHFEVNRAHAEGGSVAEVIDRTLMLAARLYPEHDGIAGCLVLDGTRNTSDSEARALTAAAKRTNREAIRDFIAIKHPDRADELAEFVTIAMAGMSAAARMRQRSKPLPRRQAALSVTR